MAFSLYPLFLAFVLALVEGFEASLFFMLSLKDTGLSRTIVGAAAGVVTAGGIGYGFYLAYGIVSGDVLDYIVGGIVFFLGIREIAEGLGERRESKEKKPDYDREKHPGERGGWRSVWKAYAGLTLETTEVILYTIAVAHASQHTELLYTGIAGAVGFLVPFVGVNLMIRLQRRLPEWKQELGIGVIIVAAALLFTGLKAGGIL